MCLVDGWDSPSLRRLAGASPRDSMWEVEPLIRDTADELGLSAVFEENTQRGALEAILRRYVAGALAPREVAAWAHANIGHDGPRECDPFVNLDDMYDEMDVLGYSERDLDDRMAAEASALLAGESSPGTTVGYGVPTRANQTSTRWWSKLRRGRVRWVSNHR